MPSAMIMHDAIIAHDHGDTLDGKPPNQRPSTESKPPNEEGGHITVTRHTWRDVAATSRHVDASHVMPRGRPPKKRLSPESSRLAL
jgi:hypothetical protein